MKTISVITQVRYCWEIAVRKCNRRFRGIGATSAKIVNTEHYRDHSLYLLSVKAILLQYISCNVLYKNSLTLVNKRS